MSIHITLTINLITVCDLTSFNINFVLFIQKQRDRNRAVIDTLTIEYLKEVVEIVIENFKKLHLNDYF